MPPQQAMAGQPVAMLTSYRQLFALLDRAERRQFYLLFALVTLMAVIDLVGVAAVLPFLAVATDPDVVRQNATPNFFRLE